MIEILFHVSTEGGARLLLPLARACRRAGHAFAAFFTYEGVLGLADPDLEAALGDARAVVCQESWHHFRGDAPCPVELGSQTANSSLAGAARRVVSL